MKNSTEHLLLITDNTQFYFNQMIAMVRNESDIKARHLCMLKCFKWIYTARYEPDWIEFRSDDETDPECTLADIDWQIVVNHYKQKIKEGC
jgi:hypothetical protein